MAASGDATVTGGLHRRFPHYAEVRIVPSMRNSRPVQEVGRPKAKLFDLFPVAKMYYSARRIRDTDSAFRFDERVAGAAQASGAAQDVSCDGTISSHARSRAWSALAAGPGDQTLVPR